MASRLELALNDAVRLTTAGGEAVSGSVHALDEQTHTLVLRLAAQGTCAGIGLQGNRTIQIGRMEV